MPSDVVIDGARCLERIRKLYSTWRVRENVDFSTRNLMYMY